MDESHDYRDESHDYRDESHDYHMTDVGGLSLPATRHHLHLHKIQP